MVSSTLKKAEFLREETAGIAKTL
jgi:hypothetical protein